MIDSRHQAFLTAYMEHGRLTDFADLSAASEQSCLTLSRQDSARLEALDVEMTSHETPLFNRHNVKSHLQALSAEGQHLDRALNLDNPAHYRKISAASLAFNDDKQAWQASSIPLEDKFQAMRMKVTLRCDKSETQSPGLWHRRLGLLRDIAVQGSATAFVGGVEGALAGAPAAGVGSVPGALMGAGYGFFSSALALTAAYAFTPVPETPVADGVIDCELVSLLPEYFIAGNVPDRLLNTEAKAAKERAFQIQLGQQTLNHLQRLFPCSPDEAERFNEAAVLQQIGAMIAEDKEGTQVLLQSILKQQNLAEQTAERDRQEQRQERQALMVLLGGIDKQLAQMDAQMRAEQQARAQAARVERAKQAADGLVKLGTQIHSPFLQKIGTIGGTLIGLEQALLGTAAGFKSLAQGGISTLIGTGGIPGLSAITGCFSFLAGPIGIVSAALSLFSMFRGSKQNDALAKALQGISKQIVALHKEMRESFQYTWHMLNEMEQRQYERFELTLRAIDYIGTELMTHIDKLATEQRAMRHQLEQGMQLLSQYVRYIADQSMLEAFERARLASSRDMTKHLDDYVASIHIWLTRTATWNVTHGQIAAPPLGSEQQIVWNSQLEERLTKLANNPLSAAPLGFYRSLVGSVMPHFVDGLDPAQFIIPSDWLSVQAAYAELIRLHKQGIVQAEPRVQQNYIDTFSTLSTMANTNLQFISRFTDDRYAPVLVTQLIQHYQEAINAMRQVVIMGVERARQSLNERYTSGIFSIEQPITLPHGKVFDTLHQTKAVCTALTPSVARLGPWLQHPKRSEDILPAFFGAINKHQSGFSSTLMTLLNDPRFLLAYDIGAVELVFHYDMAVPLLGGLLFARQFFNTRLIIHIKGVEHELCHGQLVLSVNSNLLPEALASIIDYVMINFHSGDLQTISTAVFNTLPKEEELAPQRKLIAESCSQLMDILSRRALEMANIIQLIAPDYISENSLRRGLHAIQMSIDTLISSPTAEHLQALISILEAYHGFKMLGRTEIPTADNIAAFCLQLQIKAQSHPLIPELAAAVSNLQNLGESLPLWIKQQDDISIEPLAQLQGAHQRIEALFMLDEALQTNHEKQLSLESRRIEWDVIRLRVEYLVAKQILDDDVLHHIQKEQVKIKQVLTQLSIEAKKLSAQRRECLQLDAKSMDLLPKTTGQLGWMGNVSDCVVPTSSSSSSSVGIDAKPSNQMAQSTTDNSEAVQTAMRERVHQMILRMAENAHIDLSNIMPLMNQMWTEVMRHLSATTNAGILFLGDTRKGKSTFINYLLGTIYQLSMMDVHNLNMGVLAFGGAPERAKTSSSMFSETFALEVFNAAPFSFIDTPGSTDNRKLTDDLKINAHELAAAVGFQLLGVKLAELRGVALVIEMSDLVHSNIEAILKPFRKIARVIGKHSQRILTNTVLIITKKELVAAAFTAVPPSLYLKRYKDNLLKAISSSDEQNTIRDILDYFIEHPDSIIVSDLLTDSGLTKTQFRDFFNEVDALPMKLFDFGAYSKELKIFHQLMNGLDQIKNKYKDALVLSEHLLTLSWQDIQATSAALQTAEPIMDFKMWSERLSVLEAYVYKHDSLRQQLVYAAQEHKAIEALCEPILSVRDTLLSERVAAQVVVPHTSLYQPADVLGHSSASSQHLSIGYGRELTQ